MQAIRGIAERPEQDVPALSASGRSGPGRLGREPLAFLAERLLSGVLGGPQSRPANPPRRADRHHRPQRGRQEHVAETDLRKPGAFGRFRAGVAGRIQALMELGTGFHPEFTGRQNIHAALAYQGLPSHEIRDKEAAIVDFAELEGFIDQPLKTYSAGMYTRLAFSTATAVEPDILIIDEVLGAGDAYFAGKCFERMRQITIDSGATVLFVSHDLASVQKLCDRVVWLERGCVRLDGEPLDVSKAYYKTVQQEEAQRLLARSEAKKLPSTSGRWAGGEGRHVADSVNTSSASPVRSLEPQHVMAARIAADSNAGIPLTADPKSSPIVHPEVLGPSIVTWGQPDPRIEAVRFLDGNGQPVAGIEEGNDLVVEVSYCASAEVHDPVFAMTIYLADGTPVCHANTALGGLALGAIQGRGKVCFEVSAVPRRRRRVRAELFHFQVPRSPSLRGPASVLRSTRPRLPLPRVEETGDPHEPGDPPYSFYHDALPATRRHVRDWRRP